MLQNRIAVQVKAANTSYCCNGIDSLANFDTDRFTLFINKCLRSDPASTYIAYDESIMSHSIV